MKILYLSNLYPPNAIGGYERLCFNVASALVGYGHETVVLTSDYGSKSARYPGQRIIRDLTLFASRDNIYVPLDASVHERSAIEERNAQAIKSLCALEKPDVIFVWNLYFLSVSTLDALNTATAPVVYFLTDNWLAAFLKPAYVGQFFRTHVFGRPNLVKRWLSRLREPKEERCLTGRAIFSSEFMADFYSSAGLIFNSKIVIHNGVNFLDKGTVSTISRAAPRRPGTLSLLFAGRVVEIKGVLTAIRALPLIAKRCSNLDVEFTIVGDQHDGPFVAKAKEECERLGMVGRVIFRPAVSEAEMPMLFDNYDLYLFPSLYEPFSLTLLHAMHSGIPIVCSRAGGNLEAIENGRTGLLHDIDDHEALAEAVERLVKNPSLRVKLGAAAAEASKRFTFGEMIARTHHYLESMK